MISLVLDLPSLAGYLLAVTRLIVGGQPVCLLRIIDGLNKNESEVKESS